MNFQKAHHVSSTLHHVHHNWHGSGALVVALFGEEHLRE